MVRLEPVVGKHGKAAKTDATAKSAAAGLASVCFFDAASSTIDTMLAAAAPSTFRAVALAQPTAETAPSAPITAPVAVGKPAQDSTTDPKADHAKFGQGSVHRTVPTQPASASSTAQAQMQRHAAATPPTQPEPFTTARRRPYSEHLWSADVVRKRHFTAGDSPESCDSAGPPRAAS